MDKIAEIIKINRNRLNLTQAELAEKLFVTRQSVSSWERGKSLPDVEKVNDIAKILDISVEMLLRGKVSKLKKVNRFYKLLLLLALIILSVLVGIKVNNLINPAYLASIKMLDYECEQPNTEVLKYYEDETDGKVLETFFITSSINVEFPTGNYCITVFREVEIIDNDYENPKYRYQLWSGGFVNFGSNIHVFKIEDKVYMFFDETYGIIENKDTGALTTAKSVSIKYILPPDMKDMDIVNIQSEITQ